MKTNPFYVALLMLLFATSLWASNTQVDGIWYDFYSSTHTATVTFRGVQYNSYSGEYSGQVTIPSVVNYNNESYSVTSIGNDAFNGCSGLTSVTIPESVTSIGSSAFYLCIGLTSITIPNSVTDIAFNAFSDCIGLTSIVVESGNSVYDSRDNCNAIIKTGSNELIVGCRNTIIPYGITSIGAYAFSDCSSLTDIAIPNSVTSIGDLAFSGCSSLTNITIPNSVTSIEWGAFSGCSSLTNITIPNSVTSIERGAFSGCSSLTDIAIPNSVTSIGNLAFSGCSSLTNIIVEQENSVYDSRNNCNAIIETATNTLIAGCQNTIIPNSVTSIGDQAFYGCSGLTSVTIPNSVTSFGSSAFERCTGLTSVTIPNSVTSIGMLAFSGCNGLTSVTIPNSVTSIGGSAFYLVPNIVYSGSATGSPWGARSVNGYVDGYLVFSDETKSILLACSKSAIGNIILPNSVTILGNSAFAACTDLTSITIPNSVISIGEDAFGGCSALTNITIPNSVTSIEWGAFSGCSSLTNITIPNSVTSIGLRAFSGCSSLTDIAIPNSVTSIGNLAFSGCCGLTNITIPNSITSIGEGAFEGCTALASILNYATNPQPINENVFRDIYFYIYGISAGTYVIGGIKYPGVNKSTCKLFVPKESISKYKSADVWRDFNTIEPINEQDIENATIDTKPSTKILHNGQIFILRGNKTYTLTGQEVK